jgi:3-hydroxy-9,10-secoandrosta-1,3,5(10)-triene-9,17-dione monooxygenase reductase component
MRAPLIPGCSARFQCRTAFRYDGGDHVIFVGEVLEYDRSERYRRCCT